MSEKDRLHEEANFENWLRNFDFLPYHVVDFYKNIEEGLRKRFSNDTKYNEELDKFKESIRIHLKVLKNLL